MEEFSEVRFKQRAVIEFLTAGKVPPFEILKRMQAVYGESVCWCECSKTLGKVKPAVMKWFQKQNNIFLKDGVQKPVQRWLKCIEVRGDFVEK